MTIELYACYGAPAHEYKPVYGFVPATNAYDLIEIIIPDNYAPYENVYGNICLTLPGIGDIELLRALKAGRDDQPTLVWYDGHKTRFEALKYRKVV